MDAPVTWLDVAMLAFALVLLTFLFVGHPDDW